jgi:hypothetical protein
MEAPAHPHSLQKFLSEEALMTATKRTITSACVPQYITVDDYKTVVQALLGLATRDVGGSRVAAQVLLNLYNGDEFHVDLTDLCLLDERYYAAAMVAIRGRVEFRQEPHELLENGSTVFGDLWEDWIGIHVKNRYAKHYQK